MAPRIVNFAEWSAHLLGRLARQIAVTGDAELERLYAELAGYPGVSAHEPAPDGPSPEEILLPLRLRDAGTELSLFSTMTVFGTALDVTLAELSIEAFYPADAATGARLFDEFSAVPAS
jgi:hypothetical protein